eukprot:Partr_v1_DN23959_c0_g1_i2_m48920 putative thioredoxin domain-containing protein
MPSTADLEDDLLAALEREEDDDHEMHRIKERRLEQLRREMNEVSDMKARQHGEYLEVLSEKEILEITTSEKRCVVHFFHNDFRRCQVMDGHLKVHIIRLLSALACFLSKCLCQRGWQRSTSRPSLSRWMWKMRRSW